MKKIIFFVLSLAVLTPCLLINFPTPASAQAITVGGGIQQEGFSNGEIGTAFGASGGAPADPRTIVTKVINIVLTFLGIIFTIIIIYSGFRYMTAGGNEEIAEDARRHIMTAVIGLIIIIAAWGISNFIFNKIGEASGITSTTK